MKRLLLSTCLLLWVCFSYGQTCLPDGITFTTQEQIDNFATDYPGCTEILGSVEINSNEIYSLVGLENITSIVGEFVVKYNSELANFNGLNNIVNIGSNVAIYKNEALVSLSGLENISTLNGYLSIWENDSLINLNGLNNLDSINGNLIIEKNPVLTTLSGLNNLNSVEGDFEVYKNHELYSLNNLNMLSSVGGKLLIRNCDALQHLSGLDNLTSIGGNLEIRSNDSLEHINSLLSLTSIGDGIYIYDNNSLTNLNGLNNLLVINGNFSLIDNNSLVNIDVLNNFSSLGGGLSLNGNNLITSLESLNNISSINGGLSVKSNEGLTTLIGLDNLVTIGGGLTINYNSALENLQGLNNLTTIGGAFIMDLNNALTSINGLSNLISINGSLSFEGNETLLNIDGLLNVTNINGGITFWGNNSLTSLLGLSNLLFMDGSLFISQNSQLSGCAVNYFCETLPLTTSLVVIGNNATGCNDEEEIIGSCLGLSYSGYTYYDFNQNQQKDGFEGIIPSQQIQTAPQNNILFTNQNGRFLSFCEEDQPYTFTWIEDADWQLTTDSTSYSTVFEPYNLDNQNNNFGLYPTFTSHDYSINTTSGQTRCNTDVNFHVDVCNQGTFLETDGTVTINYDELIGYVNAVPEPLAVDTMAHTITWAYDTLYPWQCLNYLITFEMPDVESIGEFIEVNTEVSRDSMGVSVLAQEDVFEAEIVCSYDPNDKLVDPRGEQDENYTLKEETFDYTVRFQNTGNIFAIDVTIRDTLDADLDWSTFRVEQASHAVQTTLSQDGAVTFYFKDIYLLDSLSNPLGSQGFVRYSIDPMEGLPDYTVIDNTAYIYFDQNPPIVTNTTTNTMVDEIPVGVENLTKTDAFKLYPNPTTGQVNIVMDESLQNENHQWQLRDVTGHLLRQYDALPNAELDLSGYPSGLYMVFLQEQNTGRLLGAKRVLVAR